VRVFFLHHATFSINSICHFFGRRRFPTPDRSKRGLVIGGYLRGVLAQQTTTRSQRPRSTAFAAASSTSGPLHQRPRAGRASLAGGADEPRPPTSEGRARSGVMAVEVPSGRHPRRRPRGCGPGGARDGAAWRSARPSLRGVDEPRLSVQTSGRRMAPDVNWGPPARQCCLPVRSNPVPLPLGRLPGTASVSASTSRSNR
jgi:hypothetical protein